ncbi:MAG: tRNA 4-thiouridine(8) synthase ThiI [Alphaproteobacteria bacterium]|nr:tRNA 4-thiouridine(8) synthase ThiI [Alphaproteobacteria bacterium]|tara:strand:- start:629 stop:2113 length:1485 start_codon:yes stop_codon:yes gene_type:complete
MEGQNTAPTELVVIRPSGEITLKAPRARRRFQESLRNNITDALRAREIDCALRMDGARILLTTSSQQAAGQILPKVFGIKSFSLVEAQADCDITAIVQAGSEAFANTVRDRSFAVRAKRSGHDKDRMGFTSVDIAKQLGAALNQFGSVDLGTPDVAVEVEAEMPRVWMYANRVEGAGGLPLGVQGRALTLLSGGFDSAVAAWRIMKRGVASDFLLCNLGGSAYERMVLQVAKVLAELWAHGQRPRFFVVDFNSVVDELRSRVRETYLQIALKWQMYRIAELIAVEEGHDVIVTGEAIGQVSSQTLKNLASIDAATALPIIRPLITHDKHEIIVEAERIGTAPLSARVREYCALSDAPPVTASSADRVIDEIGKLDSESLPAAAAARTMFDLKKLGATELRTLYLFVDQISTESTLVDCQPRHMFESWHAPDAVHVDPETFAEGFRALDKAKPYVVYCTYGTQSPYFAEIMQQAGYEAYAFRGGLSAVKKACEEL